MEPAEVDGAAAAPQMSLVIDYGEGSSTCGYCHSREDTSFAHGMQAELMSPESYQALLDRGWRRSGRWMYKPIHSKSCCQLITIRLDVDKFQPNKNQRRVQRKWDSYLAGEPLRRLEAGSTSEEARGLGDEGGERGGGSPKRLREESPGEVEMWDRAMQGGTKRQRSAHNLSELVADKLLEIGAGEEGVDIAASPTAELSEQFQVALGDHLNHHTQAGAMPMPPDLPPPPLPPPPPPSGRVAANLAQELTLKLREALVKCIDEGLVPKLEYPEAFVDRVTAKQRRLLPPDAAYTSPSPLAIAGVAKRKGGGQVTPQAVAEMLRDRLQLLPDGVVAADVAANGFLNFRVEKGVDVGENERTVKAKIKHQSRGGSGTFNGAAAGAPPSFIPRTPPRHFEFTMRPSSDSAMFAIEFELYKKYQTMHHGDSPSSVTMSSYRRFLCDSPILASPASSYPPGAAPPCGFGSFHQQYWIDGRLVAVGVVDILPQCLSSKYLFWDPDFGALSLGRLASLQEIGWVREAHAACASLRYYYLGFYIHSCHRMCYKAEFAPSDVLCPVGQCWVPISRVGRVLASDARPPVLSAEPGALDGLGEEHLVGPDGRPMVPSRRPTAAELDEVKLSISVGARRRQVVKFRLLKGLGVLPPDVMARLERRLSNWVELVGPAWRNIVYQ